MSEALKLKIKSLTKMLKGHDCDISLQVNGGMVRFMSSDKKVELSEWMAPTKALAWCQGYLIGTGHKWAKEMDL